MFVCCPWPRQDGDGSPPQWEACPRDGDIITMVHSLVQHRLCGHWDPVTDSVDLGFSRYCVEVAGMQLAIHCQEMTLLNEKPW